jgi:hypothetical protein
MVGMCAYLASVSFEDDRWLAGSFAMVVALWAAALGYAEVLIRWRNRLMSERIIIEVEAGPRWNRVGSVAPDEPPGSIADQTPDRRDVYVFGWLEGQGPCLWRSIAGADVAEGDGRVISTVRLEVIAHLNTGPHTIRLTGRDGNTVNFRFRYQRS